LSAIAANLFLPIFCHHGQDRQPFYARVYLPSHLLSAQKDPLPHSVDVTQVTGAADEQLTIGAAASTLAHSEEFPFFIDALSWKKFLFASIFQIPLLVSEFYVDHLPPIFWIPHAPSLAAGDLNLPPPDQPPKL
jgi:hypothetical protein